MGAEVRLQIRDFDQAEMEDRGSQEDGGPGLSRFQEVFQSPRAVTGHDFGAGIGTKQPDQREIVSGLGPVGRFAGGQNDLHAVAVHPFGPLQGIHAGGCPTAVNIHLIARRHLGF